MNLYRWFNNNLRGRKGQQGFTLIELLVVVTILGILAAIVTLSLVGLTTHANVEACNAEYKTVQSALDAYIADQNTLTGGVATVAEPAGVTNDMRTPVPLYNGTPSDTAPNFTRNAKTQFYYHWNKYGQIDTIADSSGAAISGCKPI